MDSQSATVEANASSCSTERSPSNSSEPNPPHPPQPHEPSTCIHPVGHQGPSNEYVLNVAFVSFIGFVIIEAIFAIIGKSQSMLADAEAMSVDAMTYLVNLMAEHIKHTPYSAAELQLTPPVRHYRRELIRLYLEFLPPLISVITLMMVTIMALQEALQTLRNDYPTDGSDRVEDDSASLPIMLTFSSGNLLLDIMNVTCFARAHNAFGLQTVERETPSSMLPPDDDGDDNAIDDDDDDIDHSSFQDAMQDLEENDDTNLHVADNEGTTLLPSRRTSLTSPTVTRNPHLHHLTSLDTFGINKEEKSVINLNMCSAWTHVCADTLRSMAVLVAAGIATLVPGVESGVADAAAAVAVSVIILASLIPLLHGLYEISCEIYEHWTRKP